MYIFRSHAVVLWLMSFSQYVTSDTEIEIDPEGYIAFCPCMGRFGNQADQFLGALAFAKSINRTFIIPHWIEYVPYESGSHQIPFSTYFDPDAIHSYHKSIPMDTFMKRIAPRIWPPEKRISFCYMERGAGDGCNAKEGNPFGPFWDKFGIDFIGSEIYGPSLHHISNEAGYQNWKKKYSGRNWPVLAFVGPPSSFPVQQKDLKLQKFLVWNKDISRKAWEFIKTLPKGPFIGIHLRNGLDWSKACELVDGTRDLFSSPQCTGYTEKVGRLSYEMCSPSAETIVKQLKRAVKRIRATSVFVASDRNHMTSELRKAFKNTNVSIHTLREQHQTKPSPHIDLAILGQSTLFIGNCVSSFSAFVKRERDINGFPTEFWGFPGEPVIKKTRNKTEL